MFSIQKSKSDAFDDEIRKYLKMSSKYAKVSDCVIFNDKIAKAQAKGKDEAYRAYDENFLPKMGGFNVVLDECGKDFDSFEFAKIFANNSQVSFFIGGAYGLSENFKQKANLCVKLSSLTMAHKVAKLVLFEQIFRGLCINANHPYHK